MSRWRKSAPCGCGPPRRYWLRESIPTASAPCMFCSSIDRARCNPTCLNGRARRCGLRLCLPCYCSPRRARWCGRGARFASATGCCWPPLPQPHLAPNGTPSSSAFSRRFFWRVICRGNARCLRQPAGSRLERWPPASSGEPRRAISSNFARPNGLTRRALPTFSRRTRLLTACSILTNTAAT